MVTKEKEKDKSLTLVGGKPLPADMIELTAADCGVGLATEADQYDRTQLKVLQPLSPPLDPNDPFYNPEAKVGDYSIAGVFTRPSVEAIFVGQV